MPFMTNGKRDYKREKEWEDKKKPQRKEDRKARGRARTKMGLSDGDPRQVDHKKPLSRGGSNKKSNLRVTSAKANAKKEVARKRRAAKKK
jgi:5-methylcytosine-specific restriction endonuclease McrA